MPTTQIGAVADTDTFSNMDRVNKFWNLLDRIAGGSIRTRGELGAVYLTFDDGPHPQHTATLLDLLARHGVKATFFLVGAAASDRPDLVRRMRAEGHAIGNHSMDHKVPRSWFPEPHGAGIDRAEKVLADLDGPHRHLYRPPHGRVTLGMLLACLGRRQPVMLWTIDSMDYRLSAPEVVQRLRARPPTEGDVILLHDDHPGAHEVLAALLPEWQRAGLRFAALS